MNDKEKARWRFIAETTSRQANGCWLWTGATRDGRPWTRVARHAHLGCDPSAALFEAYHRPLKEGECVGRRCANGMCVRDDHLVATPGAGAVVVVAPPERVVTEPKAQYGNNTSGTKHVQRDGRGGWMYVYFSNGRKKSVAGFTTAEEASEAKAQHEQVGQPASTASGHPGIAWDAERKLWSAKVKHGSRWRRIGRFVHLNQAIKAIAQHVSSTEQASE